MKNPISGMIMALFAIFLLAGCNGSPKTKSPELKLEGNWELVADSSSAGCFSRLKFLENPASKQDPISVHETSGDTTKMWIGEYEWEGDDLREIRI
ncbi:hypothetical protein [Paenibacillus aceti]|uniref:Lipocalin-like domain-containing protein n=1 Tax=Paenibacillus aceti TaxID=1820010 RepID=A0ABQ1VVV4_9BACL|nr:hypothetical protein [Paenibacillus aceti]GGG01921.1 hypothetical protein GCM10010913_24540 [Paenibacillus aceti]